MLQRIAAKSRGEAAASRRSESWRLDPRADTCVRHTRRGVDRADREPRRAQASSSVALAAVVNGVSDSCAIAVARLATSTDGGALRLSMKAQVAHDVTTMPPPAAWTSASRRRDI